MPNTTALTQTAISEPRPGRFTPKRKMNMWRVILHALASGDTNKIHFSKKVARKIGLGARVVHGDVVISNAKDLIRRSWAKFEPRSVPVLAREQWEYLNPVFYGQRIFVEYTVRERRSQRLTVIVIKATVHSHSLVLKKRSLLVARGEIVATLHHE